MALTLTVLLHMGFFLIDSIDMFMRVFIVNLPFFLLSGDKHGMGEL